MCGIAGFIGRGDKQTLEAMAGVLAHRGPDAQGVWQEGEIGLAHTRLSIIDLSPLGGQPMHSTNAAIVFNGEIYNFRKLRAQLLKRGARFKSQSDTEVILEMYESYGAQAFAQLDGMFAFALYDRRTKALYLVRDRAGEKPLYWSLQGGSFVFASEPKALFKHPFITKQLSSDGVLSYLANDAALTPMSVWHGIYKVPPSTCIQFEQGRVRAWRYWEAPTAREMSFDEAKHSLDKVLKASVEAQLVSDVPLGVFLSGGLDSSAVAYYASKAQKDLRTFSLGFEEASYDESSHARTVADFLGTKHAERKVSAKEVRDVLPEIVQKLDEPLNDTAMLPQYLLSQFARGEVKVALGGDGGDELFLGYPTFAAQKLLHAYQRIPVALRGLIEPLVRALPVSHDYLSFDFKAKQFIRASHLPPAEAHQAWLESFSADEARAILTPPYRELVGPAFGAPDEYLKDIPNANEYTQASYLYLRRYLLDVLLTKADRASMYHSLEVRAPFLSRAMLDLAFEMPSEHKLKGMRGKYVLRKLMEDKLPKTIVWRGKHGFGLPVSQWLKNEWRQLLTDVLSESNVRRAGICEPKAVSKLVEEHLGGKYNHRKKLWSLMMLHLWYDFWVK